MISKFFTPRNLGLLLPCLITAAMSASVARADDSSDADARAGYLHAVLDSSAVIIRVPINDEGKEFVGAAEMRLLKSGDASTSSNDVATEFAKATDINAQPKVSAADISRDSDTCGWYGYSNWGSYGWNSNYFSSYSPFYYNYGNYYGYGYNSYNNYYGGYNGYYDGRYSNGYRYYTYGRRW